MTEQWTDPGRTQTPEDIATAPGDLPMPEVSARFAALSSQFRHDNTIEPLAPRPGEPVTLDATSGTDTHVSAAAVYYTIDGRDPGTDSPSLRMRAHRVEWYPGAGFVTHWTASIPGQAAGTTVRYRIGGWQAAASFEAGSAPDYWAHDGQGFWFRFPGESGITTFAFRADPSGSALPAWMKEAVIYHIFLDRFHPGTPDGAFRGNHGPLERHGGTFAGVRQALPYLADLGVTCLWYSPLGPSETYHRYDTIDYFDVDPALGTMDEFKALVRDAHQRGIRTWLDFVPSHSSWRHPAFLSAQEKRDAPTYSWYTFNNWPHDYRNFMQSSRYLPSFNTQDPGARSHLIDSAVHWLRECGVDGYRIDHVIAAGMDFWLALRNATEAVKDDVVLVGEATDTPDSLRRYRGHLHGILDFPLARALRLTFGAGVWNMDQFDSFLSAYESYMGDGPGTVSFLDNHDMDRFLWVSGNNVDRLKLAAICQFTLGATPAVYYGTEIGMSQKAGASQLGFGGDSEARADMIWDAAAWDSGLLAFYRDLIRLRRQEGCLQSGIRRTVHVGGNRQTYAYRRVPKDGLEAGSSLLVTFNLGIESQQFGVTLPEVPGSITCLLSTGETPAISQAETVVTVTLPPMSAAIFRT